MEWNEAKIKEVEDAAADAIRQSAIILADRARALASKPVGRVGGKIIRSSPGEHPRYDSGEYVRRIDFDHRPGELSALVGSLYNVAGFLNKGTSKMQPRPNLSLALNEQLSSIHDRITRAIGRVF